MHQDGSATNRSRNSFSVQKPFGSSKIGHRSERFCVFLPIFAGRDGEGNEQKLGEEWGQAKQWKFVLKKNLRPSNTSLPQTSFRLLAAAPGVLSVSFCFFFKMWCFDFMVGTFCSIGNRNLRQRFRERGKVKTSADMFLCFCYTRKEKKYVQHWCRITRRSPHENSFVLVYLCYSAIDIRYNDCCDSSLCIAIVCPRNTQKVPWAA